MAQNFFRIRLDVAPPCEKMLAFYLNATEGGDSGGIAYLPLNAPKPLAPIVWFCMFGWNADE